MSWADSMLEASFRGIVFDCISTSDEAQREIAEHSYPYLDGADIEDLGRAARRTSMRAIFFGDDYELRLQAFLRALDDVSGTGTLVHPVFGEIQAQLVSRRVGHEADEVDQCSVTLEFIESTPGNPFFDRRLTQHRTAQVAVATATARSAASAQLAKEVGKVSILKNVLRRLNDLRASMNAPLNEMVLRARGYVASGLDVIGYPTAFAADIVGAAQQIRRLVPFNLRDELGSSFGGAITTTLSDWGVFSRLLVVPVTYPSFTDSNSNADQQVIVTHVAMEQSLALADLAADLFDAEADTPTLTPPEIETICNQVRENLQASIEAVRALYPLVEARPMIEPMRDCAHSVTQAAREIIETRPPLIDRVVEAPGNHHLIAHRWYGDWRRAGELLRLNPLVRFPNDIQAGDVLHAFAR